MMYLVRKFNSSLSSAHVWLLVDNSENPFTFVAEGKQDADIKIYDPATWGIITKFANNES